MPTASLVLRNYEVMSFPRWIVYIASGDIAITSLFAEKGLAKYLPEKIKIEYKRILNIYLINEIRSGGFFLLPLSLMKTGINRLRKKEGPMLYTILVCSLILFVSFLITKKSERVVYVFLVSFFLIFKIVFIILNEKFAFFPPKIAGNYALLLYEQISNRGFMESLRWPTFIPQLLINYIPLELFGPSRIILLISNAVLTTFSGVVVYHSLRPTDGVRLAFVGLVLFNIFPAAFNFSLFGLRDPLIYFAITLMICSLYQLFVRSKKRSIITLLVASVLIIGSRPELISIVIWPPIFLILYNLSTRFYAMKKLNSRILVFSTYTLMIVLPAGVLCYFGYNYVVSKVGLSVSPIDLIEQVLLNCSLFWIRYSLST